MKTKHVLLIALLILAAWILSGIAFDCFHHRRGYRFSSLDGPACVAVSTYYVAAPAYGPAWWGPTFSFRFNLGRGGHHRGR